MCAAVLLGQSRRAPGSCRESRLQQHPATARCAWRSLELGTLKIPQQPGRKGVLHRPGADLEDRLALPVLESQRIAVRRARLLQAALLEQSEQGPGTGALKRARAC